MSAPNRAANQRKPKIIVPRKKGNQKGIPQVISRLGALFMVMSKGTRKKRKMAPNFRARLFNLYERESSLKTGSVPGFALKTWKPSVMMTGVHPAASKNSD